MEIDRSLQNKALLNLKEKYPEYVWYNELFHLPEDDYEQVHHLLSNLEYLKEHGLVVQRESYKYTITAKGIDFITNDGGLSAILNVQTIKLHQETIDLIAQVIQQSTRIPNDDKQKFVDQLKELPAETTKHILFELVSKGIDNIPNLLHLIGM